MPIIPSRTPSIYQIRHIESGKVYVGSSAIPGKRHGEHWKHLRLGTHHSRHLQRAWNKYGEDAFVFEIIEPVLFVEDLIIREQYWIDKLRACDGEHGYNVAPVAGSVLGLKRSEEACANIKRAKADPAHRANLSARLKECWADPEYRAKRLAQMADPVARAKQSAGHKRWLAAHPDERANIAARTKAKVTPEDRAKWGAKYSARWANDPDFRARRVEGSSEHAQALWNDPDFRAKRAALQEARNADPEYRAKSSARAKALWENPEYRARVMNARAEHQKKKKK